MSKLNNTQIADLIMYRGVGFSQSKIAEKLGVSQSAIQYHLAKIKAECMLDGVEQTFFDILSRKSKKINTFILLPNPSTA